MDVLRLVESMLEPVTTRSVVTQLAACQASLILELDDAHVTIITSVVLLTNIA